MSWTFLPFTLELRAPALLSSPGGDPNSAATLGHVPGSALRGAVARALGPQPAGEPTEEFHHLVLSGHVRYLNAYPTCGGTRALPAPVAWRSSKKAPGEAIDLSAYVDGTWPTEPLGGAVGGFVTLGANIERTDAEASGRFHHQRDRTKGRAWKEAATEESHGTIFGYESLDAGQRLAGLIAVDDGPRHPVESIAGRLKELLDRPLLLGKSRRAGYGGDATIAWGESRDRELLDPSAKWLVRAGVAAGTRFRALLTSPYVGRNLLTGSDDPTWLEHELDATFRERAARVRITERRWRFTLAGGYNRTWGAPLPQRHAAAAGSMLLLMADGPLPLDALREIENQGLGERRVDGYGRVAFLTAAGQPTDRLRLGETVEPTELPKPTCKPSATTARIEQRLAEDAVSARIADAAADLADQVGSLPRPSLLGRLRVPLRAGAGGLETLGAWFENDENEGDHRLRRPATDQLDACRLAKEGTLLGWLRDQASASPPDLGGKLQLAAAAERAHIVSAEALLAWLNEPRRMAGYRVRLVDAVLAALQQRAKRASKSAAGG